VRPRNRRIFMSSQLNVVVLVLPVVAASTADLPT
jgi:hypothetical protein